MMNTKKSSSLGSSSIIHCSSLESCSGRSKLDGYAMDGGATQQGDAQHSLDRGQHFGQYVVGGNQRIGLDINSVAWEQLIIRCVGRAVGTALQSNREFLIAPER